MTDRNIVINLTVKKARNAENQREFRHRKRIESVHNQNRNTVKI